MTTKKTRKTGARKTTRSAKAATRKTTRKTARKAAKPAVKTAEIKVKAGRAKMALVERLQGFGLLDQSAVERLEKKVDALAEASGNGLDQATSLDRALNNTLGNFEEAGGDGSVKRSVQSLVTWIESLGDLPGTREGIARAMNALKKVFPYHGASLYLRNPDTQGVDHLLSIGFEVQLIGRIRFLEGNGFSAWVATRKKPVLYASLHRNEAPGLEHVRSFMAVPLMVGGNCVGVLNLGHRDEEAYDQAALRRLLIAGGVLAGLVQRYLSEIQVKAREIQDPQTHLATTDYIRRRLEEEVVRCRELGHSMSLVTFKLSEFAEYADQFGDEFRQRCRQELAGLAESWRGPTELVGHGKNESLVVILPSARREKAQARAEAFAQMVKKHNFPRRKRMTVEFGVGTYPADAEESQELLEYVDKSLQEGPGTQHGFPVQAIAL